MKQKNFLMKMAQDIGTLSQAFTQQRILLVRDYVARWLAYVFETISSIFTFKISQRG